MTGKKTTFRLDMPEIISTQSRQIDFPRFTRDSKWENETQEPYCSDVIELLHLKSRHAETFQKRGGDEKQ